MTDLGARSQSRRRWAVRIVLGALALTLGVVIVSYVRRNFVRPQPRASVPALPQDVQRRLSGFTFTRSRGTRRVFTIQADRTLAFKTGGATVLSNVVVQFFGRNGERHDILRTREGTYFRSSGDFSTTASVQIELDAPPGEISEERSPVSNAIPRSAGNRPPKQPYFIETSGVDYRYNTSVVQTAAPVEFRAGPVSGTAVGMRYATRDGWIELQSDVNASLTPRNAAPDRGPIRLSASKLRFDKNGRRAELWGPIEIRQGDRTGSAQHGYVTLDGANRVTHVELEGGARVDRRSPRGDASLFAARAQGTLDPFTEQLENLTAQGHVRGQSVEQGNKSSFEADHLQLMFGGPRPQSGRASGNVRLHIFSSKGMQSGANRNAISASGGREEFSTKELHFVVRPGTTVLKSASAPADGRMVLYPQSARDGVRTITAGRFSFAFDSLGRIRTMEGNGGTRIEFAPPAGSRPGTQPASTTAEKLVATFNPQSKSLLTAEQVGNFQFKQGNDQARAERAVYRAAEDSLLLDGHPEAWDATTRTMADRVIIGVSSGNTEGEGDVRVTRIDRATPSGLPTNILADQAVANRRGENARYVGNVRAWHGTDVIETSALDIDRSTQKVVAGPSVVSSYMVAPQQSGGGLGGLSAKSGPDPLTIRAEKLDYSAPAHKAIYEGRVSLKTQNTVMHADRLEVYFADSKSVEGSQVERAVAEGNVEVTQPGRRATGDRADYNAGLGEIVMTGGPPTLYDSARGVTSGERLTFFISNDSLKVERGFNSANPTNQHVAQ